MCFRKHLPHSGFTDVLDQLNDRADGILLTGIAHGIYVGHAVLIKLVDRVKERFFRHFFLFEYKAEALAFKRTGIQDLVAAAGICRERNEEIRFSQCKKLTDGISAGTG